MLKRNLMIGLTALFLVGGMIASTYSGVSSAAEPVQTPTPKATRTPKDKGNVNTVWNANVNANTDTNANTAPTPRR